MADHRNAERFMELWLEFHSAAFSLPETNPALIEASPMELRAAEKMISSAKLLLNEYGDELMAAAMVAQEGMADIEHQKNISVSAYHGSRAKQLTDQIAEIDSLIQAQEEGGSVDSTANEADLTELAELKHKKKSLEHKLSDHEKKFDNRGHGFRFQGMRKRR